MATHFGRHNFSPDPERERLWFMAAAGLTFSLAVILCVLVLRTPAEATRTPERSEVSLPELGTVTVYTPTADIGIGTKLRAEMFTEQYWPKQQAPAGMVYSITEFVGRYASTVLRAGVPIERTGISEIPTGVPGLEVRNGYRAISIRVDEMDVVEGWARAGQFVDVNWTSSKEGELSTKTIVQNARVLSLGGKDVHDDGERRPNRVQPAGTVTLELTPLDALTVRNCSASGDLSLALRNPSDTKAARHTEVSEKNIRGIVDPPSNHVNCSGHLLIEGQPYSICDGELVRADDGL